MRQKNVFVHMFPLGYIMYSKYNYYQVMLMECFPMYHTRGMGASHWHQYLSTLPLFCLLTAVHISKYVLP